MQQIDFPPLGRKVSCIGFGCGGLDGRYGLKRSARLIEAALDLGINYFDVAPSYGTAEEALGKVIGDDSQVVVTTKVGQPHLPYPTAKMFLRETIKPALDRATFFKRWLTKRVVSTAPPTNRPRYDFSLETMEKSIAKSLANLRRSKLDVVLAHEPHPDDLGAELAERFNLLVERGALSSYGVGIGAISDQWSPFGQVWQSAWPGDNVIQDYRSDVFYIFHRVIRNAPQVACQNDGVVHATELIKRARSLSPNSLFLVAASTPKRLREMVEAANEVS
ncbi:aldo/keto reductase [Aeoliella mucimassa]|uniref:D-threo-aldose 1-dehydrogenase n=1 Tax=Aeoliella mucimassa TaxID=2527972 RepID=A0A518AUT3_9BACT|nr:aldo/keto reductase [Aeoliella mucimassa]QDU58477.1 D-threo-aldose 1-dehydrogenase [Aeoliella mucimassa]